MCAALCVCLQPVFHLGLPGFNVSNMEGAGANQISRGTMDIAGGAARLLPDANGSICWSLVVHKAEQYQVAVQFEAAQQPPVLPDFQLQVGRVKASWRAATDYKWTQNATVVAVVAMTFGPKDVGNSKACLRWLQPETAKNRSNSGNATGVLPPVAGGSTSGNATGGGGDSTPPAPLVIELRNLRFVKVAAKPTAPKAADGGGEDTPDDNHYSTPSTSLVRSQVKVSQVPAGMPADLTMFSLAEPALYRHLQPTPAMQEMERRIRAAEVAAARRQNPASGGLAPASTDAGGVTQGEVWKKLQQRYRWADQQGRFESLFRPCKVHSLPHCAEECAD
jgi:hypothetical protein